MAGYKSLITRLEGSPNARRRAEVEEVRTATYQDVVRDKVIVGGPDTVVDRLKELEQELGIDGILFELNFGAAIPAEIMMRSLELICKEVMPRFR
jgi:alkanesulfonate monooxygenase SsuD/methylene tetrahydromethanopterin reductase-like flavin-dependent oxidoreductase (luciferase family)